MGDVKTDAATNAQVLAELVIDPQTTTHLSVSILNKLIDSSENPSFFVTMFEERMSLGECPNCGHENHWLIPEDSLNQLGWVTHEEDKKIPQHTDAEVCPEFQEACSKRKINP